MKSARNGYRKILQVSFCEFTQIWGGVEIKSAIIVNEIDKLPGSIRIAVRSKHNRFIAGSAGQQLTFAFWDSILFWPKLIVALPGKAKDYFFLKWKRSFILEV
jgi:hypothetical protein